MLEKVEDAFEVRLKPGESLLTEVVEKLGLHESDKLDIREKDGTINIIPVVVYPKNYLNDLKEEITDIKKKIESGAQPMFNSVDELFENLDSE